MTKALNDVQQRAWRAWLGSHNRLVVELGNELQAAHGMTLGDFEILRTLAEQPRKRMRMSELANVTLSSRSRLSHQIDRLGTAGLVVREQCADDRRGLFAVLTKDGQKVLKKAVPTYNAGVREHYIDQLSELELTATRRACEKICDALGA